MITPNVCQMHTTHLNLIHILLCKVILKLSKCSHCFSSWSSYLTCHKNYSNIVTFKFHKSVWCYFCTLLKIYKTDILEQLKIILHRIAFSVNKCYYLLIALMLQQIPKAKLLRTRLVSAETYFNITFPGILAVWDRIV